MAGPAPSIDTASNSPHARLAILVSAYHADVTDRLLEGALLAHRQATGLSALQAGTRVRVVRVPGAWELVHASLAAAAGGFDGVVALGCIIKGQTSHDRVLGAAVTDGLMRIVTDFGLPVGLGVLTVDTLEQARARSGGSDGNKGADAMRAVLASLDVASVLAPSSTPPPRQDRPSSPGATPAPSSRRSSTKERR